MSKTRKKTKHHMDEVKKSKPKPQGKVRKQKWDWRDLGNG